MHFVTNLGDLAVLLPASLGLIAFLAWIGSREDAAAYAAASAVCLLAALFAKLGFAACGARYSAIGVESPSGHSAFGATFYGCLAVLFGAGRTLSRRLTLYAAAVALVLLIGASRVALEAHTASEVAVGLFIGAMTIGLFPRCASIPNRCSSLRRRSFECLHSRRYTRCACCCSRAIGPPSRSSTRSPSNSARTCISVDEASTVHRSAPPERHTKSRGQT